jgi:hypothetical protein
MKKIIKKFEDYDFLLPLIGVDLNVAMEIFSPYMKMNIRGYPNGEKFKDVKKIGGFPEELFAFAQDVAMARPKNKKGPDFEGYGECKSVKVKMFTESLNRNQKKYLTDLNVNINSPNLSKIRGSGNPIISFFEKNSRFYNTNVWGKIKKVVFIYHFNDLITDIRIFDGVKYMRVLCEDYELIKNNNNIDPKIFTLKKKTNTIQVKKNLDAFLSESIVPKDFSNNIVDQQQYIETIFKKKLEEYKENNVEEQERIENFIKNTANSTQLVKYAEMMTKSNKLTPSQLIEIRDIFSRALKGCKYSAKEDDLPF